MAAWERQRKSRNAWTKALIDAGVYSTRYPKPLVQGETPLFPSGVTLTLTSDGMGTVIAP